MSVVARPNILCVVIDCARADAWHGPGRTTITPHFDRLVRSGAALPTTITEKACTSPCFASLLTGRFSPRHGVHLVWGYRLPQRVPMLTDELHNAGYTTYAEVTGPLLPDIGLDRGFTHYSYRAPCDYLHTTWGEQFRARLRSGYYRAPWFIMLHLWELHEHRVVSPRHRDNPSSGRSEYERAVSSLDEQLGPLLDAAGAQTLTIVTGDHGEKTPLETYADDSAVAYTRKLLGGAESGGMAPYQLAQWAGPSVLHQFYGQFTPDMSALRLREWQPRSAGRLSAWRDRLRLLSLTPFVYLHDLLSLGKPLALTRMLQRRGLTDPQQAQRKVDQLAQRVGRGRLLDMHMRMWTNSYRRNLEQGHMVHLYDFLTRVPLALRWEGRLAPGAASPQLIRQVDILPTLLDLLGLPMAADPARDGRSAAPVLRGEPWVPAPAYQSVTGVPQDIELRGVRTAEHRYTFGPHNPELPEELYDLRSDPHERHNLAAQQPQTCAALRRLADQLARGPDDAEPLEAMALSAADQQRVESHLRSLGYIE